jgi:hypothetical protein
MTKLIGALMMVLSLSLFGGVAVNALDSSPAQVSAQDGDKGEKKHKKGKRKNHAKKGTKGKKGKGKKGSKKLGKKRRNDKK